MAGTNVSETNWNSHLLIVELVGHAGVGVSNSANAALKCLGLSVGLQDIDDGNRESM